MKFKKGVKRIALRYKMIKNHPISGKAPFLGFLRYIKFNSIQSLFPKKRVYNWINGLKFYAQKGDAGLVGNIYYKLMDYEESTFLMHYLNENELFVDVGANLGQFTLLASGVCKANAIAIEPIPQTVLELKKNITLNSLENKVTVLNCGISDKKGLLNFTTDKSVMNAVALTSSSRTLEVKVDTLDHLLLNKEPVFIKIDVEGFELNVLKGANETLNKASLKYVMVEFNNSGAQYGFEDAEVYNLILQYNFVPIRYNVEQKSITKLLSFNTDKFNTLFIKKELLAKTNA